MSARLSTPRKAVFGIGDFTINTVLSSLSLIYASYFLIEIAELRPAFAGLIPVIGRTVDAITDPLMGRISDRTRWRLGRRRPYFLIGAVPFGLCYALLWVDLPGASQMDKLVYYTSIYIGVSLWMTLLTVPYMALIPEMAQDYDDRTSLNAFRNLGSVLGTAAAIGIRPLAESMGGGAAGIASATSFIGVVIALPWVLVHYVSFERPDYQSRPSDIGLFAGLRSVARHGTYMRLVGLYLCGRISMDLVGAMLILYFTYWIGRSGDFEIVMGLFLAGAVAVLPLWLRVARSSSKRDIFILGSLLWTISQLLLLVAGPDWPRWSLFMFAPLAALGYCAVDLMPWSMVGDVIDEDDLATGERREGLYNGVFTFLRKLGGALGVAGALLILDLVGFERGVAQSETTLWTLRLLTSLGPAACLVLGVGFAWRYPLTRERHEEVLARLAERDGLGAPAGSAAPSASEGGPGRS